MAIDNATSDKLILRIVKLLSLADPSKGATPAEAASAFAKAQELITLNGLELADIRSAQELMTGAQSASSFDIGEDLIKSGRVQRYDYETNVARILMRCFGVRIIWCKELDNGRSRHAYIIVGERLDRALARAAYPILCEAMIGGVRRLLREELGGAKWTAEIGRNYYDGLEHGYCTASKDGKARVMARAKKENAEAYAIVLVDKDRAISLYYEKSHPDLRTIKQRRDYEANGQAFVSGMKAGEEIDLNNADKLTQ